MLTVLKGKQQRRKEVTREEEDRGGEGGRKEGKLELKVILKD